MGSAYSAGAQFETLLAHVHGTLFGVLNIVISWMRLGGILMPIGILGEVVLGVSPIFVLVGAISMTKAVVLYGFAL